ncbi:unnamed protein product [Penicillium pancosmium]
MATLESIGQYTPSVIKSCSRCRARKVKCDLNVPQCSACSKQGETCNITEHAAYPYSLIKELHSRVNELERDLETYANDAGGASGNTRPVGISAQQDASEKPSWSANVSKEAEEVGVLAIGFADPYSEMKYVGAAAGSTFARIFFKQVGLDPFLGAAHNDVVHHDNVSTTTASIPTRAISKNLLSIYIARIHLWWPFMHLRYVRTCFQRVYLDPRECKDFEKFIFFIVLALASDKARHDRQYTAKLDLNSPEEYFQSALHFFWRFHDHPRDLPGLQAVILLTLWMLNSTSCHHGNDIWHLTRYAMSIALELGLHRHNPLWNFGPEELELRARTWWSIYNLERFVALSTGRVLSVRDQAIDTPIPSFSSLDRLTDDEAKVATIFHSKSVWIFAHVIKIQQIAGRILESIYIARSQNRLCTSLSFQEICSKSDELHQELAQWRAQLDDANIGSSREYEIMKLEYYTMLLHLNRPSPAFMIPSQNMITICSHASSQALHLWAAIVAKDGIEVVCRCYRQFHDILMVGLARLYCDWHTQKVTPTITPILREEDAAICLDLLCKGVASLRNPSLSKFLDLFSVLKTKVYASVVPSTDTVRANAPTHLNQQVFLGNPADGMEGVVSASNNGDFTDIFLGSDVPETYLDQVSSIFDSEVFSIDDALTAWYGSVLDDVRETDNIGVDDI